MPKPTAKADQPDQESQETDGVIKKGASKKAKKSFGLAPLPTDRPDDKPSGSDDTIVINNGVNRSVEPTTPSSSKELTLDLAEQEQLNRLIGVIRAGMDTFKAVGMALAEVRDNRLYREKYATFEDFCNDTFGLGRRRAYQLMDAAEVVAGLAESGESPPEVMPTSESHAAALADVEPDKRREVWDEVVKQTQETGDKLTAKKIAQTNERLTGKPPKGGGGKSKGTLKGNADTEDTNVDDEFSDHQAAITRSVLRAPGSTEEPDDEPTAGFALPPDDEEEDTTPGFALPPDDEEEDTTPGFALPPDDEKEDTDDADRTMDTEGADFPSLITQEKLDPYIEQLKSATSLVVNGEIMIHVMGTFLIRNQLTDAWKIIRGMPDLTITPDYVDSIPYGLARQLGLIQ